MALSPTRQSRYGDGAWWINVVVLLTALKHHQLSGEHRPLGFLSPGFMLVLFLMVPGGLCHVLIVLMHMVAVMS